MVEFTIREKVFIGQRRLVVWVLVAVCSLLSITYSVTREVSAVKREFANQAWQVERAVIHRVANLETVLTALVGQHHASDMLSSAEQTLFSQELLIAYPFIHSVMHVERVATQDVAAFERRMKVEGFVGFKLKRHALSDESDDSHNLGFHLPVSFIEPMEPRTASLLGYDLANESSFTLLIEQAIRDGDTTALETLQNRYINKPLYLILKPVYLGRYPPEAASERWEMLSGFAVLRIDFEQFFSSLELPGKDLNLKLFRATPGPDGSTNKLLAEFGAEIGELGLSQHLVNFTQPLEVHGLQFTLSVSRVISLNAIHGSRIFIEWLITMLVLGLIIAVYRNRRYAQLQEEAAEEVLAIEGARFTNVIDTAFDAVITADGSGRIVSWNQQAKEVFGYDERFVLGLRLFQLILPPEAFVKIEHELKPIFENRGSRPSRLRLETAGQRKNGQEFPLELAISSSTVGSQPMLSIFARDITERKRWDEKIRYLAYCDSLTDLPNRQAFKEQVSKAINTAKRHSRIGAVLYLDLDEFKRINDTLGHDIGDMLLQHITKRLVEQVRVSDTISFSPGQFAGKNIARLGGDEFTVLLDEIEEPEDAAIVAKRVQSVIASSYNLNGHDVYVTPSIGIAIFPRDGHDVEELLKNADTAMYHAKAVGKNNFQFYTEQMNALAATRLKLEGKLRKALVSKEMELYYQPQIDMRTGQLVSAEALLRWHQPELGMIPPDEFIPIAEETGMIIELGEWVLNEACRQNKAWQDSGHQSIRVAINLSSMQFIQRDLSHKVDNSLRSSGLDPKYLEFEITESILMRNVNETIATLNEFKMMGINISVDDFGTGYSSLSYLKRFPLNSLKIDRSFIRDIPENADDVTITSAIIAMAHQLNLGVVAEGVESQRQLDFLHQQGCEMAQGYFFSKPLPAEEFEAMLVGNDNKVRMLQQR
ncbi:MAG: EAL domain-containing protein [Candidatus Thiodiazotropha endolucinida]|nr:EAL domain-containing protein [Candidatus Thiodiazotropha taylori]MCW4311440.1 EAL domain-containing protein [Candidatus Thiodiazotropha taylori]